MRSQHKRLIIYLGMVILAATGIHLTGFLAALHLPDLPLSVPKEYLILRNGLWTTAGIIGTVGFFRRRTWAWIYLHVASLLYVLWYWVDRLALSRSEYGRGSLGAAILTAAIAGWFWWGLRRSGVKIFLGRAPNE